MNVNILFFLSVILLNLKYLLDNDTINPNLYYYNLQIKILYLKRNW